jgi:hypothetical protein
MTTVLALTPHAGARLAEIGFLLILIAGVWLAIAQMSTAFRGIRTEVAGLALAAAGILLIVATHWGHFGV